MTTPISLFLCFRVRLCSLPGNYLRVLLASISRETLLASMKLPRSISLASVSRERLRSLPCNDLNILLASVSCETLLSLKELLMCLARFLLARDSADLRKFAFLSCLPYFWDYSAEAIAPHAIVATGIVDRWHPLYLFFTVIRL